jgi:hypothetical protein
MDDLILMSVSFDRRDYWIFDMDGTLTLSIHDFDGIKRILGLPITYGRLRQRSTDPRSSQ